MQAKTGNHASGTSSLILIASISMAIFLAAEAEAASYKWTDASGDIHYTNDPLEAEANNAIKVDSDWIPFDVNEPSEPETTGEQPEQTVEDDAPAAEGADEKKGAGQRGGDGG